MYIPAHFEETRIEVMHALMRAHPLAALVTLGKGGLTANHIPLFLSEAPATLGKLQGHVAKANNIWHDLVSPRVLAIFQGPEAYITPSWYPTKKESGKVVPTWNYAVVHAHGTFRAIEDPQWLKLHLEQLTSSQERNLPQPWQLSDAPEEFTAQQMGALMGIEITIDRLEGKWKASQNQPERNRAGIMGELLSRGTENDLGMASLMSDSSRSTKPGGN